ncbi:hypothetical protein GCM10007036_22120 [Alsobacter metallidurans]|uniref:Minor curlin subunit n=2 Tax=Alsobacter metallidurans TaxID=340221 RepID=A0A917MJQ9_9HYPH|nr:hypothetical protein GCM10007036_22120 [Alsobacter metallidurans]
MADCASAQVYVDQIQPTSRSGARSSTHVYAPAPTYEAGHFGSAAPLSAVQSGQDGASIGAAQRSTVQQTGTRNTAAVVTSGEGNVTSQVQNGRDNISNLSATGAQNTLATVQNGAGNSASVAVAGNNNSISNTQIGAGSSYTLQHVGNGQSIAVTQVR